MYRYLLPLLLLTGPVCCLAQEDNFVLPGKILERLSKAPIASVSIRSRRQFVTTNANGEFKIMVRPGDTLVISHISYQPKYHIVGSVNNYFKEILMDEKVVDLREVEVKGFISEERFKYEVLSAVPKYEYENKLANRNQQLIKQISPLKYARDLGDYSALLKNAKSVNEISFFSSNPSVGLIQAIRQIGQGRNFKSPSYPIRPSKEPLHKFGVRTSKFKPYLYQE